MEPVTTDLLMLLVRRLGERLEQPLRLYLLGGSAMLLLGSPRATKDVDYDLDPGGEDADALRRTLEALATDIDPAEFREYFDELERLLEVES